MDVALALLFRLAILCGYVILPGWAALRLTGFRSRSRADRLLVALALGSAYTAQAVTILLLLHAYTRVTAGLLLLVPVAAAAAGARRHRAQSEGELAVVEAARDPVDRAVLTAAGLFVCVYLVDAATSPMTWWDGLATWGKWAPDWGRRTDSMNYLVGGYPQLVPRLVSVVYKLTGSGADILPLDFFAAHAFHVLFSAWFLVAAVRLSDLIGVPAWPAVLAGLGSLLFREHTGAGTVDVLVAAQVLTVLALYQGWRRRTWDTTGAGAAWVLGGSVFAALFTKFTGVTGPLLMAALHAGWRPAFADPASHRTVRRALALGVLLLLPFVAEQGYTELRRDRFQPQPFEVNLSVRQTPRIVGTDAELTYRNTRGGERWTLLQLRFWNSYEVPGALRLAFTLALAGCLLLSLSSPFGRGAMPVIAVFTAMWAAWSSYDQRNIFPLLPVAAIAASLGARAVWAWRPRVLWQSGVALFCGLFLVFTGAGLLKDVQRRAADLHGGAQPLAARLQAMRGGADERIALFYPQYLPDYRYVRSLALTTHARHVLVTSPMYRFLPNGAHPWGVWPYHLLKPGDLFVGHEAQRPPDMPGWVFVRQGERHRIWVHEPALTGQRISTEHAGALDAGTWTRLTAEVSIDHARPGGYFVWEAAFDGAGPVSVEYPPLAAPPGDVRSTATETLDDGSTRVSGLVAVDPRGAGGSSPATMRITLTWTGRRTVQSFRSSRPAAVSYGR